MAKSLDAEAPEVAKTTKGNYKEFFPDQNVSFWKKIFFLDIDPLIIYGHKVALQSRNLFHYPKRRKPVFVVSYFPGRLRLGRCPACVVFGWDLWKSA
jgi:hypothetical protein